jgi:hypothetical protein
MKAYELKSMAKSILDEMERLINDLARMAGYVYDPERAERMERLYDTKGEQIIHRKLKDFQEIYIRSLNMATEKAMSGITPLCKLGIPVNPVLNSGHLFTESGL